MCTHLPSAKSKVRQHPSLFLGLLLCLYSLCGAAQTPRYVLMYPHGNGLQTVFHAAGSDSNLYHFAPGDRRGQGFHFTAILLNDTAGLQARFPKAKYPNPTPRLMAVENMWAVADLKARYRQQGKQLLREDFDQVLSETIGNGFQIKDDPKLYASGKRVDNLDNYIYRGKHCMLLWDTPAKCIEDGDADTGYAAYNYDFDYSLKDAHHLILCRYAEDCYVLMLLTKAPEDMTRN